MVLLRDETVNEWCTNKYLVPSKPNPTQFEGSAMAAKRGIGSAEGRKTAELVDWSWSYFYDVASCMRLLDPEEYRYNHTSVAKEEEKNSHTSHQDNNGSRVRSPRTA